MFDDDDDRTRDWAGGGGWQDPDPPPDSPPPKQAASPPPPKPKPKIDLGVFEPKAAHGLVAGRFLPLHVGHEHLIEVARRSSQKLDVVVFGNDGDPIPSATRARWIRDTFPNVTVYTTVGTNDFAASIQASGAWGSTSRSK